MTNADDKYSRRKFLTASGVAATAGLAGCSGGDGNSNGGPDTTGNGDSPENNAGNNDDDSGSGEMPENNTGGNGTDPGNRSDPGSGGTGNETAPNGSDSGNGQNGGTNANGGDSGNGNETDSNGGDSGNGQDEGTDPGELDLGLVLESNGSDSGIRDFWKQINIGLDGETGEYDPEVYVEPVETGEGQKLSPGDEWLPERLANYEIKIEAGDETLEDFEVVLDGEELDNTELGRTDMMNLVNLEGNRDRLIAGLKSMPEQITHLEHATGTVISDVLMMQYLDPEAFEQNRKLGSSNFYEEDAWLFQATKTKSAIVYGLNQDEAESFSKSEPGEILDSEDGIKKKDFSSLNNLGVYGSRGNSWVDCVGDSDDAEAFFQTLTGDEPSVYDSNEDMPESGLPSPVKESNELVLNLAYNTAPNISALPPEQVRDYSEEDIWLMVISYDPEEHLFKERIYAPDKNNENWELRENKGNNYPYEVGETIENWEGAL